MKTMKDRWFLAAIVIFALIYGTWLAFDPGASTTSVTVTESGGQPERIECPAGTRLGKVEGGAWGYSYYCWRLPSRRLHCPPPAHPAKWEAAIPGYEFYCVRRNGVTNR